MKYRFERVFLLITLLTIAGFGGYFWWKLTALEKSPVNCTPAFVDGGGPYYTPNSPFRSKLAPDAATGTPLVLSGSVLRRDCRAPAAGVTLDFWQADETGEYRPDWYRGQVRTNATGEFRIETIKPKGYGEGTAFRPPHLHFKVWEDGKELVTSQLFFPESRGQAGFDDAFTMRVNEVKEGNSTVLVGYHDIILP